MNRWIYALLFLSLLARVGLWRQARGETASACTSLAHIPKNSRFPELRGEIEAAPNGGIRLSNAYLSGQERGRSLDADIRIEIPALAPELGHQLILSGPFHCQPPFRNPGRESDGLGLFEKPRLTLTGYRSRWRVEASRGWGELRPGITRWLSEIFQGAPWLEGLEIELWTGDPSRLPDSLARNYRNAGLWHLLAQGALRVAGLAWVVMGLLGLVFRPLYPFRFRWQARIFEWSRRITPLISAGFLCLAGGGAPSMARMVMLLATFQGLRVRRLDASTTQRLASCLGILIAGAPDRIASPGFWLGAAGAALLTLLVDEPLPKWGHYFFFALALPVFFFPLGAFFFARITPLAPIESLALAWLWGLVWLPLGFLFPFLIWPLPKGLRFVLLIPLERMGRAIAGINLTAYSLAVPRPNWTELVLLVVFFGMLALAARRVIHRLFR